MLHLKIIGACVKKAVSIFIALSLALFVSFPFPLQASSNDGFVVLPGDILQITVWKEDGMDREVQVLSDGTITFPLIGTVKIENKNLFEIQLQIKELLYLSIPTAAVTVSVKAPLGHKLSILGQVQNPGEFVMNTNIGVMQLISQAGGLTPYADEDKITIIRKTPEGKKQAIEFPYKNISRGKNLEKDIYLKPGDVVFVPNSGLF